MYCKNCGKEIDDLAVVCPNCGVATGNNQPASDDTGSIGWGLLGCCIPIVGLILCLRFSIMVRINDCCWSWSRSSFWRIK